MRVLILSDIHANLVALETVLSDAADRYDTIWCLGDLVGYGPRPNECVEVIRTHAAVCVMGNHDWAVLGRPGIDVDDFNPQARQAVIWTREQLTEENRAYLDGLADVPITPDGFAEILVTHASPREPVWEYILTPTTALENFAAFEEPLCFVGHTHKPAIYRWQLHAAQSDSQPTEPTAEHGTPGRPESASLQGSQGGGFGASISGSIDSAPVTVDYLQPAIDQPVHLATSPTQRLIVNPGSVGQPRDNDARAAYAIFDTDEAVWLQARVPYPVELTQGQMREAGLPKRLIDRLSFGW